MFRGKGNIVFFVVLALWVGLACSLIQKGQGFSGIPGEAQDAGHNEWVDIGGPRDAQQDQIIDEGEAQDEIQEQTIPEGEAVSPNDSSLQNTSLGQYVQSGEVEIESIETIEGGTQGEIMEISVTNQSEGELLIEIPAGLVFTPVGTDQQNMMVLDALEVNLQPQETTVLSPYVICIQAEAAAPSSGSSYQLGYLESDVLLEFAQCVDEEADGTLSQDDLSLQIAVWSITSGENALEMPELTGNEEGALSELMEELEAFTDMMDELEGATAELGDEWLQRCDISTDNQE